MEHHNTLQLSTKTGRPSNVYPRPREAAIGGWAAVLERSAGRRAQDANLGTARIRNDLVDKHTHTNRNNSLVSLNASLKHNCFTVGVHNRT